MKALLAVIPALALGFASCRTASAPSRTDTLPQEPAAALPPTVVYLTDGDYADNVPVTLNEARTAIVSYPDPRDISATSHPIRLAGGWLLDRRGVTPASAFLDYTYKEYAALPSCPDPVELMRHIIPGSHVTEIRQLPIRMWQAVENPVEASKLVGNAPVVYQAAD